MSLNELTGQTDHPVDIVEQIAAHRQWAFERSGTDEISISIEGGWSHYEASFTFIEDMESLHLGCAFDLRVPAPRQAEVLRLISMINEQMWVGHFDLWQGESVVMFRHSLLLAGCRTVGTEECEALLTIAVNACERYYQAFQFVVWAGKSAREALDSTMFETIGQA